MPIGSATGASQGIRQDQLHGLTKAAAKPQVSPSQSQKDAMVAKNFSFDKLDAKQSPSGRGATSPSTQVTLSKSSDAKDSKPLTYSKSAMYSSKPYTPPVQDAKTKVEGKDATAKGDGSNNLKSFASGALGLDSATQKEKDSDSYQVGQFLKAAATVGGMIALFV